nr:transposase [Burkholderia gladioli]
MKKSRFAKEQMVTNLREADKAPVAEMSKEHGISEQTIYNWRQHFGGMDAAVKAWGFVRARMPTKTRKLNSGPALRGTSTNCTGQNITVIR